MKKSFNADSRALDVGCAVGASSFVLGKYFGDVLGVDFSQNFIDAANTLKEKNSPFIFISRRG
jgi:2-polyprenyl-3-methyl-5-hydroxy-6-metoxy-1,4-benzoquinol methylase